MTTILWRGKRVCFFTPPMMLGSLDITSVLITKEDVIASTNFTNHPFSKRSEMGRRVLEICKPARSRSALPLP